MVGKFLFGVLTGGALVAGGFVVGSALFPMQEAVAPKAPDPAPASATPGDTAPVPAVEPAAAPEPAAEALAPPQPDALAEPASEPAPVAEAPAPPQPDAAEPAPEPAAPAAVAEAPTPPQPDAAEPAPEPVAPAAVAEAPAPPQPDAAVQPEPQPLVPAADAALAEAPADATLPRDESESAAVASSEPATAVADPVIQPATPAQEPALPTVTDAAPVLEAQPAATAAAEVSIPPAVAEVPRPLQPPAPLKQLDTDAVLAALDSAAAAPPAPIVDAPVAEAAVAPPAAEPIVVAEAAQEPVPEPVPLPSPEPPPEPEPVPAPEPAPEPAPDAPAADGTLPPPVAENMPAPDPEVAALPGTAAPAMPGNRPGNLPVIEGAEPPPAEAETPAAMPEAEVADGPAFIPAPGLSDQPSGVVTGRLPRIGDVPATVEEAPAPDIAPADDRPIAQFAATFENPDAKPAFAIVLIDPGTADLDRAGLAALPFPVSFALDPMDPATPERAAVYRGQGKEVVMLATGLAEGGQASDVEVSFQSMAQALPDAVAVMDLSLPAFQNRRPLASLVVPVVGAQGRGLLTWDQGLNAADQVARRDDIPAAVIFRDLASAGTDSTSIRRVLDRAVFKAGQDGRVVLAGTASPEVVAALLEWTVEGRAATVALAPLTAVMTVE